MYSKKNMRRQKQTVGRGKVEVGGVEASYGWIGQERNFCIVYVTAHLYFPAYRVSFIAYCTWMDSHCISLQAAGTNLTSSNDDIYQNV